MPFSSEERDRDLFRHIIEAYGHIDRYLIGVDLSEFLIDSKTQDATAMRLQQILECATKISDETKAKLKIQWSALAAMRNKISHSYNDIDPKIIWQVINDLPEFQKLIQFAKSEV